MTKLEQLCGVMSMTSNAITNFFDRYSKIPSEEILDNVDELISDIRNEQPDNRQKLIDNVANEILKALPKKPDEFAYFVGRQLADASCSKKTFYHTLSELISLMLLEKKHFKSSEQNSDSVSPIINQVFTDLKYLINQSWQNRKILPCFSYFLKQSSDIQDLTLSNLKCRDLAQLMLVSKAMNKTAKLNLIRRINNETVVPPIMTFKEAKIFFAGYESQIRRLHLEEIGINRNEFAKAFPHITHLTLGWDYEDNSDLSFLSHLKELKHLKLHGINDKKLSYLRCLSNLESLSLIKHQSMFLSAKGFENLAYLNLKSLTIEDSKYPNLVVSDACLSFLAQKTKIEDLHLTAEKLTSKTFKHLVNLKNIKNLTLNCSNIKDDDLCFLEQMPHLKTLNLSFCSHITDECFKYFKNLKQLEKLDLSFCHKITGEGFQYFDQLNQLETLNLKCSFHYLERSFFSDIGLLYLESKTNMKDLNLRGCYLITNKGLSHLAGMHHLKTLKLSEMRNITKEGLEHIFKEMKSIQSLSISNCFNVKCFKFLSKMSEIKFLELLGPVSGNIAFEGLDKLEELDLTYTNVTDNDLEPLNELKNLKQLKIIRLGQNVTEEFVKNLKKNYPNTYILLGNQLF